MKKKEKEIKGGREESEQEKKGEGGWRAGEGGVSVPL